MFLLRLAVDVNWDSEKDCFHTVAKQLALQFQVHPVRLPSRGLSPLHICLLSVRTPFPQSEMYLNMPKAGKDTPVNAKTLQWIIQVEQTTACVLVN